MPKFLRAAVKLGFSRGVREVLELSVSDARLLADIGVGWIRTVQLEQNRQRILGALLFEKCLRLGQRRIVGEARANEARQEQRKG